MLNKKRVSVNTSSTRNGNYTRRYFLTNKKQSGNILHTVHTSCHPTLQHCNSYNRTDNHRQWNAVSSPDDGHKDARNMLR